MNSEIALLRISDGQSKPAWDCSPQRWSGITLKWFFWTPVCLCSSMSSQTCKVHDWKHFVIIIIINLVLLYAAKWTTLVFTVRAWRIQTVLRSQLIASHSFAALTTLFIRNYTACSLLLVCKVNHHHWHPLPVLCWTNNMFIGQNACTCYFTSWLCVHQSLSCFHTVFM